MLDNHPMHDHGIGYYFREIGITDSFGLFNFCKAVQNFRFEADIDESTNATFNRCDNSAPRNFYLPSGFHEWNYNTERCSCGSTEKPYGTTNDHHTCLTHCRVFRVPIQTEKGFIVYLEYFNQENEAYSMEHSECNARTLQELFRGILEWQWVYQNMGNNEELAVVANEFINEIQVPEDLVDWLWTSVPDQKVARYLRGMTNARMRAPLEDIPDMTREFNAWMEQIIVYRPTIWPFGPK